MVKKLTPKAHQARKRQTVSQYRPIIIGLFVAIFAGIGTLLIMRSHALTPTASVELGVSSSVSLPAQTVIDSGTSNGSAIKFSATGGINAAPTGPTAPSSGWHVALADDFNAPLGTAVGQDKFWYPNQPYTSNPNADADGNNSYETQVYNASQVKVSGGKLVLSATASPNRAAAVNGRVQRNYVSGFVASPTTKAGYSGFTWTPGQGESWAFEIDCQYPVNTGELFNAWWSSSQSGWTNERDFFEGHKQQNVIDTDWIYTPGQKQDYYTSPALSFDPAVAMHRYTYVVNPDQSWSFYIDGVLQTWVNGNGIAPVRASTNQAMLLIINYALSTTSFTSGTRDFTIDSVAVYQDKAHAGQDITGGGIAPGTVVKN